MLRAGRALAGLSMEDLAARPDFLGALSANGRVAATQHRALEWASTSPLPIVHSLVVVVFVQRLLVVHSVIVHSVAW